MSTIKQNSGFTLVELFILIVIIAILGVIIAGAFGSKDAGAADLTPIPDELRAQSVQFMYSTAGTLTIFNASNTGWENAAAVCNALKPLDSKLRKVYFSQAKGTNPETELVWNEDHTELSNLDGLNEAVCN